MKILQLFCQRILLLYQLLKENKIPPKSKIIDHSPKSLCFPESFDLVEYTSAGSPQWKSITYSHILELLECTENEFNDYREDKRVKKVWQASKRVILNVEGTV